jgi:hypothetical protein
MCNAVHARSHQISCTMGGANLRPAPQRVPFRETDRLEENPATAKAKAKRAKRDKVPAARLRYLLRFVDLPDLGVPSNATCRGELLGTPHQMGAMRQGVRTSHCA